MNSTEKIFSVSALNRAAKNLVEGAFGSIWLEGEISNLTLHSSGHMYFTLKDDNAAVDAVMFGRYADSLSFTPSRGVSVLVQCTLSIYPKTGRYQVVVCSMKERGLGELEARFIRLKEKLKSEGLFDEKRKRPIPSVPRQLGIVTSPTGAAIRDILNVLNRRFAGIEIILVPVAVQGDSAAGQIARAIGTLNGKYPEMDAMIIGRGGGSLEDLWPFNEEEVARAVYGSKIPVISAVGHEVDITISDLAADLRAPTPSAAAELVTEDMDSLRKRISRLDSLMRSSLRSALTLVAARLAAIEDIPAFRYPGRMIEQRMQDLDHSFDNISKSVRHILELKGHRLDSLSGRIYSLSPENTLKRGYSVTYRGSEIIRAASGLSKGDTLRTVFFGGEAESSITEISISEDEK